MSVGDQNDMIARLLAALPQWFSRPAPTTEAVLSGAAENAAFIYQLEEYARLQTRIATATDGWLDLAASDFFGTRLQRGSGESDAAYRVRILSSLLRPRATREGIIDTLEALTGQTPRVFEPARPTDTGAWSTPYWGYSVAGGWSNPRLIPYQAIVVAYRGNGVSDNDIFAAIDAAKPVGTVIWTAISN